MDSKEKIVKMIIRNLNKLPMTSQERLEAAKTGVQAAQRIGKYPVDTAHLITLCVNFAVRGGFNHEQTFNQRAPIGGIAITCKSTWDR